MPRLMPKKVIVWFLVVSCFFSYGGGLGQAVICSDQHGHVAVELLHSGDHCLTEHLHGHHKHPCNDNTAHFTPNDYCTVCNDIEVSLHLFAPRRKQFKRTTDFIAKPIFQPSTFTPLVISSKKISFTPTPPSVPNPSLALLQSVILLI